MQPIRIEVRLPHHGVDELDAVLAERVTTAAIFVPFRLAPVEVDVGSWVRVEVAFDDGSVALGVDGVAAWRYPDGAVPVGREAGLGVAIVSVDVAHRTRFAALAGRAGAGARTRIPGQRLLLRQRLPGSALPPLPARPPVWTHETLPPSPLPTPEGALDDGLDRLALLAHALASADGDVTVDGSQAPPPSTENPSSSGAPSSTENPSSAVSPPSTEDPSSNEDPSSTEDPSSPGNPSAFLASPFLEGATPAEGGRALLDSADLPFVMPAEQAFERGSTDVDLLASLSAQDVVSLHGDSFASSADASDADLPSLEAELVEEVLDDSRTAARALPPPVPMGFAVPSPPQGAVGIAFTLGPRGVAGLQPVAWAPSGSKRAGAVPMIEVDVDTGAFSSPPQAPDADGDDPFAPRTTDPALTVDGLVARAVAAARESDVDADSVFGSSDHTGDGQAIAVEVEATRSAEAARDAGSEDTGEDQTS